MSGITLALISALGLGAFQVFHRYSTQEIDSPTATFQVLVVNALILSFTALLLGDWPSLLSLPPLAYLYFGLGGFFHFTTGWTLMNMSQRQLGAARTGAVVGSTPIFAAFVSLLTLGEQLTLLTIGAILLVVFGVGLIMTDPTIRTLYGEGVNRKSDLHWTAFALGIFTAISWSISPTFIRKGFSIIPSPLLGLSTGTLINLVVLGVFLLLRPKRLPVERKRRGKPFWQVLSGIVVTLGVITQWAAFDLIPVAVVLALARLNILVILVLAPIVIQQPIEFTSPRVWVGAATILSGTLALILL